jgi:diguanylate cyclase (GGDEF)-like protein
MLWTQAREQTLDSTTLLKEMVQLGLAMSAETDLERLLELVVTGAQRFTGAEGGTVYLVRPEGLEFSVVKNDVLTRRYGAAEVRGRFRGRRLTIDSSSLAGHVALTGRPLSMADTAAISPAETYRLDARFDRENQYETRSVLALPLTDPAGTVLGVLQLVNALDENTDVIAFSPDVQEVVALLAAYAAAAIRNVQLAAYSLNDHLTGAFNRRYVTMRLDEEISRTKRTGEPLSFALIDIDLLKQVNDLHGHPQGDVVIRAVAQLLINQSRAYTVVARYGGDEFAILLPSTPKAGAIGYAERMKRIVASYPFPMRPVTISIGTATMPGDADTRDDLVAAADRSLYRAKQEGRNRVGD